MNVTGLCERSVFYLPVSLHGEFGDFEIIMGACMFKDAERRAGIDAASIATHEEIGEIFRLVLGTF